MLLPELYLLRARTFLAETSDVRKYLADEARTAPTAEARDVFAEQARNLSAVERAIAEATKTHERTDKP